jgi:hypothetical protein
MLKLSLAFTENEESFYVETNTQDSILIQIKKNQNCWSKIINLDELESMNYWNKLTFENIFNLIKINLKQKLYIIREEDDEIIITFKLKENYSFPEITLCMDINGSNEDLNQSEINDKIVKKSNNIYLGKKTAQAYKSKIIRDEEEENQDKGTEVKKNKIVLVGYVHYKKERKMQLQNLNFSEMAIKIIVKKEWNSMTWEQKKNYYDVYNEKKRRKNLEK